MAFTATRRAWLDGLMRRCPPDARGVARIGARRIYILPTGTGLAFAAMLFATLLGSLNYQNNLGLFLTFMMTAIALVSMHHCWYNLLGLSVRGADAEPVFCGQAARFRVELWDQRGRPHGELCLRRGGCAPIPAHAHAEIDLRLTTATRGPTPLGELLLETQHPLGLFRAWAWVQTPAQVLVYPRPAAQAPPPGLAATAERPLKGTADAANARGADDFLGSRRYRAGDSPRQIDWKVLARERGLVTKQFGGEQAARVQLDLHQHSGELEQRLALLTRQLLEADAQQVRYGLKLGALSTPPARSERHKRRCLEALARYPTGSGAADAGSLTRSPPLRPQSFERAGKSASDRYRNQRPDAWQLGAATLLLGLGAAPLLLTLRLPIGLLVLGLLALSLVTLRWPHLQPKRWVLVALTLLGGVLVLDTYQSLVGQQAGSALLVTMLALKRLESRTRRDLRVLVIAIGFLLVIQFLFSASPWLTGWMLAMLLGAVALLADLSVAGRAGQRHADWHRAGRTALTLSAQAFPLAVVLFVFFPRLDAPLWDLQLDDARAVTGLKDWLEPGAISELIVSGEDAFRVRFDGPPGLPVEAMYWRGPVLWRTDGRRWLPLPQPQTGAAVAEHRPVRELRGEPIAYSVVLEPTDQRWLFALELPTRLPERAQLSADFQLLARQPVTDLRLYRARSVVDYRMRGLSPRHERAALQLPDTITARMRALVADWQAQADSASALVQHALAFFNQAPFRYTLLPPKLGANPADAFLFETRAGFCEHYASSFVLLMRLAGIPARIVLGYLGAEYNPLSGDYLVRQSDAHAWAEVWLEEQGWVRVDPTAAIAAERIERALRFDTLDRFAPARLRVEATSALGQLIRGARVLADALDAGWTHWVVGFSSRDQLRLLDRLGLGPLREYGLALLMGGAGALVMLSWAWALARRPRPGDPVQRCWERFGRRLARVGLPPARNEGPLHYRDRVLRARPDLRPEVDAIVEGYLRRRYQRAPSARSPSALCRQIRRFRPARQR